MPAKITSIKGINEICENLFNAISQGLVSPEDAKLILQNHTRWLKLYETTFEKDGKVGKWTFAARKDSGKPVKPDAVVIVPILWTNPNKDFTEADAKHLVIIKEYRIALQDYEYHFPAGLMENTDDLQSNAARELLEETGFRLVRVREQSGILPSSSGLTNETSQMIIVDCVNEHHGQNLEEHEDIEVMLANEDGIRDLLNDKSKLIGAKTWPILLMLEKTGL